MPLPRFPRLDAVFGSRLDQLEEQHLAQIIDRFASVPVLEDFDLDFKESLYGPRDEDKRALAQDVAALANTRGGVIMMGVAENNGAASALRPVALTDAEELRIRAVIATLVAPAPLIEMRRIQFTGTPGQGILIVAVPRSAHAPHAVRMRVGVTDHR